MSAASDAEDFGEYEVSDEIDGDDTCARVLFESGDMGVRPGQRYPGALGSSERAQRWRAVMGLCEDEHLYGLEQQTQRDHPDRYIRKLRRRPRTLSTSPKERLIGVAQFREAYSAVAFANSQGAILNTLITLVWPLLGYEEHDEASAVLQNGLIKHMREWFRHKEDPSKRPFAWMYVHEHSGSVGLHTHFLVAVPLEWQVDFRRWVRARLKRLSKRGALPKGAVDVGRARPDRELLHQWRQVGYLMKSVDPRASLAVFPGSAITVPLSDLVPYAHEGPGEVNCKIRVGIAQEIRAPARARAQYRSLLDCGVTDVRLLHADYDYKDWEWTQKEARSAEVAARAGPEERMWAELAIQSVQIERDQADEVFECRHTAWLAKAKEFDAYVRDAELARVAQLDAITKLFRGGLAL